ncbi:hypothetical protein DH2020_036942 [Rehmannia glutinosa]|uniref:Uncharacterized protein n=1 Tax=Rehmannia glutinosa TaxID=99300 RepID=A0ABR0V4G2_REHGL
MVEEGKCRGGDMDGISEKGRVEDGTSEIVVNDNFRAEDVWLEMYEVGHLGFGRVSFTGVPPFHNKEESD